MKIREITQKAENLIEQGENAKRRQLHYQQQVNSARAQLMSAYARLEAAASETDEEGNPTGDLSGARTAVYAAQALLESAETCLTEVNQQLEGIGRRKMDAVHEIERYEAVEEGNMSRLAELQNKRFGANANAFMADLAARMNSSEQSRMQLLASMGISASAKKFSGTSVVNNGVVQSTNTIHSSEDSDDTVGSIVGKLFQRNKKKQREIHPLSYTRKSYPSKYTSLDELDDNVLGAARHYQENHEKYNSVMRQNGTSDDIMRFKSIIGEHRIAEETIFCRRASLKDLGKDLENCPLEDLVGKRYRFQGIMSVAKEGNDKMASDDVVFKVIAPAGTPGLDLTDVETFYEAMFDSPLCYIEKTEIIGYNTPCISIRVFSSKEYHELVDDLTNVGVEHRPIEKHRNEINTNEIIDRLCGGDYTDGSCSSLALAFGGNMSNHNVLDFRGGESCTFFSKRENIQKIAMFPNVSSTISKGKNDIECANKLLEKMVSGKEYYLATGQHASVVRKINDHFEYLELQHPSNLNGWHILNDSELSQRFRCSRNRMDDTSNFLIDMETLSKNQEFLDILGYINTAETEQRKGAWGHVK